MTDQLAVQVRYQLRQLIEWAIFTSPLPGFLQNSLMPDTREFVVVFDQGVAYRHSMNFQDRIREKLGPVGGSHIWGQKLSGFDTWVLTDV